jgi:glutathione S-transferase
MPAPQQLTSRCFLSAFLQADEAKTTYWRTHCDPSTTGERNEGAHFTYISKLVAKHGRDGWAVGSQLSMADILLFDIVDMHQRIYPDQFAEQYPDLAKHHSKLAALPGIKSYLDSPARNPKVNGNGLG